MIKTKNSLLSLIMAIAIAFTFVMPVVADVPEEIEMLSVSAGITEEMQSEDVELESEDTSVEQLPLEVQTRADQFGMDWLNESMEVTEEKISQEIELTALSNSNISAGKADVSVSNISDISELEVTAQLDFAQSGDQSLVNSISSMSAASNDNFYGLAQGYITQPGAYTYLTFSLSPGDILHVQADMPNSASIDYDLELYRLTDQGSLSLVDSSALATYINGSNGTLSETVGYINNTSSSAVMYILVRSYAGASSTMPFSLHVATSSSYDNIEVDSINLALQLTIPAQPTVTEYTLDRALFTGADNDWLRIIVPAGASFDAIQLGLNSSSTQTKAELYKVQNGQAIKVNMDASGVATTPAGTYMVRLYNSQPQDAIAGSSYILAMTPVSSTPISAEAVAEITNISGPAWNGTVHWPERNKMLPALLGGQNITIEGRLTSNGEPVAHKRLSVGIYNKTWNPINNSMSWTGAVIMTDYNGNFSATFMVKSPLGEYFISPVLSWLYDIAEFRIGEQASGFTSDYVSHNLLEELHEVYITSVF